MGICNTKFKPITLKPDLNSGSAYKGLKNETKLSKFFQRKIHYVYPWPGVASGHLRPGGGEGEGQNDHSLISKTKMEVNTLKKHSIDVNDCIRKFFGYFFPFRSILRLPYVIKAQI